MIIDAHQHFWTLSRGDYAWPNESVSPIFRDFTPDDLAPLISEAGVKKTLLVQATDTIAETDFLLEIASQYDWISGVVGWVDLEREDAPDQINRLRQNPLLKGLRPMLQGMEDTDWILGRNVQSALRHMAHCDLRFDALIQPRHLPNMLEIATLHPDLKIVLDHIAKPRIGRGREPDASWRDGMLALSLHPNVFCKLSGMVTEARSDWQADDLAQYANLVLEAFGPDRVMFGSDWPVVNLASDYGAWFKTAKSLTGHLSSQDRACAFGETAARFYGI